MDVNALKCVKSLEQYLADSTHLVTLLGYPSYHKSLLIPIVKTRRDSEVTFLLEATPLISNEVKIQAKPFWLHTTSI